ncbi:MAG TPA: SAM-dependent chlorinase/fluorinase [Polyangiaceae bacterium]|nr:SAM-dependent chlorinase/fluorinase [Polyangiaceae bacterium]
MPCGIITLLTDFGLGDPFVGCMKGVILGRFPRAQIIDLTHGVPPQAVAEAAFWLERSQGAFPTGSVHVAVVDPGVGSERRILALEARGQLFLAPDNGLLGERLTSSPGARAVAVDTSRLSALALPPPSATFHGRDIFAPVAAALASGALTLDALGDPVTPHPCVLAPPVADAEFIRGQVVTVDRFGNLITNIDGAHVDTERPRYVLLAERPVPLARTYADAPAGELVALVNAFDALEIARRDGNAETHLGLGRGTPVRVPRRGHVTRA